MNMQNTEQLAHDLLQGLIKNSKNDSCIFNTKDYVTYEDAFKVVHELIGENQSLKQGSYFIPLRKTSCK